MKFHDWECPECGREMRGTVPGKKCRFCRRDSESGAKEEQ